jgi:hypothetical protein
MVWAVCLVVLGLCCGERVFVFCFGGERFCCFVQRTVLTVLVGG